MSTIALYVGISCLILVVVAIWLWMRNQDLQNRLKAAEQATIAVLDGCAIPVINFDEQGIIQQGNQAASKLLKVDAAELHGRALREVLELDLPHTRNRGSSDHNSYVLFSGHTSFAYYQGKQFPVELSLTRVHLNQRPLYSLSIIDISERVAAENRLEDERRLLDIGPITVFRWRNVENWPVEYASANTAFLFGYDAEEFINGGVDYSDVLHPNDLLRVKQEITSALDQNLQRINHEPYRILHADGTTRWVRDITMLVRNNQSAVTHFLGFVIDITNDYLNGQRATRLGRMIASSNEEFFVFDANSLKFVEANGGALGNLGYDYEEIRNMTPLDIKPEVDAAEFARILKPLRDRLVQRVRFEALHKRKDGTTYPASISLQLIESDHTEVFLASVKDDTDRRIAELELKESEQRMQLALKGADLGVWDWNIKSGAVAFNRRWCEMLGYQTEEIKPQIDSWSDLLHPDDIDWVMDEMQQHFDGKTETYETTHRLRHKDGSWRWILDRGKVLEWDAEGNPMRCSGTHLDVTQQYETQARLDAESSRLRTLLETIPDMVFLKSPEGVYLECNRSFERLLQRKKSEIIGKADFELFGADRAHEFRAAEQQAIEYGEHNANLQLPNSTDEQQPTLLMALRTPVFDDEQNLLGVLGVLRDITQLHNANTQLQSSERALNQAQTIAKLGSWTYDPNQDLFDCSRETKRIFGIDKNQDLDFHALESAINPSDRPMVFETWFSAFTGKPYDIEYRITVDEQVKWIRERAQFRLDESNNFEFAWGTALDITDRKQTELELNRHREHLEEMVADRTAELEEANRVKSEFLANMSHELRTPMHAILSFSDLGMKRANQEDLRRVGSYFSRIKDSGKRLTSLLNDLLDLSKLEVGRMTYDLQPHRLQDIAEQAVFELEPLWKSKQLSVDVSNETDTQLVCDDKRIHQVIGNLLSNAIKFSPVGSHIKIHINGFAEHLIMTLRDQGPGIPAAEHETIFDKFIQSSKTKTAQGGTGLGLSISRRIARDHLGDLSATNDPSGGAVLTLKLPRGQARAAITDDQERRTG